MDTRRVHGPYFAGLTPDGVDYYAGHYRGERFRCLVDYEVEIASDGRVGHTAATIPLEMREFAENLAELFRQLDMVWAANERIFSPEWKLYRAIELGAAAFVHFLEIHPFANGNGHMARLLLISILAKYGVYLSKWPMHPRPPDPPYTRLISDYRSGVRGPFEQFLLGCI